MVGRGFGRRVERGRAGVSLGLDGCEVRLCDPTPIATTVAPARARGSGSARPGPTACGTGPSYHVVTKVTVVCT